MRISEVYIRKYEPGVMPARGAFKERHSVFRIIARTRWIIGRTTRINRSNDGSRRVQSSQSSKLLTISRGLL